MINKIKLTWSLFITLKNFDKKQFTFSFFSVFFNVIITGSYDLFPVTRNNVVIAIFYNKKSIKKNKVTIKYEYLLPEIQDTKVIERIKILFNNHFLIYHRNNITFLEKRINTKNNIKIIEEQLDFYRDSLNFYENYEEELNYKNTIVLTKKLN